MGADMQRFHRVSIGILAGAVSLSLVGAAAAAAPKHATGLTKGKSPFSDGLTVIVGSPSAVVFETGPSWQRGPSGTQRLEVKGSKGKARTLSIAKGESLNSFQNWSVAKNLLVADNAITQSIAWWSLTGKAHGQKALPAGYQFLAASPNGWTLQNETTDAVFNQTAAGHHKATRIGVPFGKSSFKSVSSATSGSTGIVLRGSGGVSYLKWGTKKFTSLHVSSKDTLSGCYSLAGGALGCYGAVSGKTGTYIIRVPLSGKPAVATKLPAKFSSPQNISVSSSATAWTAINNTTQTNYFFSTTAKGHGVKTSKHTKPPVGFHQGLATSAFGKFVVVTGSTRSLKLATVANAGSKPKTTVNAARGVVHAASVSLSGNRVAYTDNQKDVNAGDVWSRNLSGKSVGGATELISTSATSDGLSISGTTTADSETVTGKGKKAKAHVAIRVGAHIGSVVGSLGQASGTNVLYTNASNKLAVYNGKSRKSSLPKVPADHGSAFLGGSFVYYIASDGSVWQVGLGKTAAPRKLVPAPSGFQGGGAISVSGSHVVWSEYVNSVQSVSFCTVTKTTCTVQSAGSAFALDAATTNGVLLVKSSSNSSSATYTWDLKPYSSAPPRQVLRQTYSMTQLNSSPVLENSPLNAQVSVASGRIAWIDPGGTAHVASLP
jgi:hypothetical protein